MSQEWRQKVVDEALTWVKTPYHHQGAVKGAGVDCAFLLVMVYSEVGLAPRIDPRPYPIDWHLHRSEEKFRGWVEKFASRLPDDETPRPGDIVIYKFGRCFSHGAIVLEWPLVIHAVRRNRVVCIEDGTSGDQAGRERLAYTFDKERA